MRSSSGRISRRPPSALPVAPVLLPRIGDVLALVTATTPWSASATVGAQLAAHWGGTLTGCFIDPVLRALRGADAEPTVMALLNEPHAEPATDPARADFAGFARRHGVAHASWTLAQAGLAPTLRQLCAWHDLAVIERDIVEPGDLLDVLGEALLGCRMPCLILPPDYAAEPRFNRVVVGWNGSLEAARAVHAALPMLAEAKEVGVLDGMTAGAGDDDDGLPHFDPFEYLERHGIAAKRHAFHADGAAAGAALLEEARRMRADLLVMGAYSHSRLRERVLGGATRYVLVHANLPVLMQH